MDKKAGIGYILVIIIPLLIVFAILLYWLFNIFGPGIQESGEALKCDLSIIEANSLVGKLKSQIEKKDLPILNCPKIPVEIKSDNKEEIIKKLSEYVYNVARDFSKANFVRVYSGKYCRERYYPVKFVSKLDSISKDEFWNYLQTNKPENMDIGLNVWQYDIDLTREYSILYVADFNESWSKWGWNVIMPAPLEERLESENERVLFIRDDLVSELGCDPLI